MQIPFVVSSPSGTGVMVRTERLSVLEIRWVAGAAAGDEVIIEDDLGNILWHSIACGSNNLECSDLRREWSRGFRVPTLDSGTLYILAVTSGDAS